MSNKDHIENQITTYNRYLQKLREREAKWRLDVPPHILIQIEDIEIHQDFPWNHHI